MTFGSLFAGIGGFDLGLERAGMVCKWQVEIDDYARRVLQKHWPNVKRWGDIRTFLTDGRPPIEQCLVDLICGGFPCQDISNAGKRAGIDGARSGLWSEYIRVVRVLRPRYVLVENVIALFDRGIGRVLSNLADLGFDAEWTIIPASSIGAPIKRERVFILCVKTGDSPLPLFSKSEGGRQGQLRGFRGEKEGEAQWDLYWQTGKSPVQRVANGVPNRVDRLKCLGNAVVPQVAEWIGRRIMEVDGAPGA